MKAFPIGCVAFLLACLALGLTGLTAAPASYLYKYTPPTYPGTDIPRSASCTGIYSGYDGSGDDWWLGWNSLGWTFKRGRDDRMMENWMKKTKPTYASGRGEPAYSPAIPNVMRLHDQERGISFIVTRPMKRASPEPRNTGRYGVSVTEIGRDG